ncbi:MAG: transposase [Chloroflexia bacterium]|nr:transposase [Chloroflexia bacterium]
MRNTRRAFSAAFKAKIAIEAIKEHQTLSELAQKHQLHPNQIAKWKKEFLDNAESVFERDKVQSDELDTLRKKQDELYQEIGKLTIDRDWLKKKLP